MARTVELKEFVLLACNFAVAAADASAEELEEVQADAAAPKETGAGASEGHPEEPESEYELALEAVRLGYGASYQGDEIILITRLWFDDPSLPYDLGIVVGSSFIPPEPAVELAELEPTLLFITFPYLRELVSSVTARSPYGAFVLPALTRLPHPRVTGEAEAEDERH